MACAKSQSDLETLQSLDDIDRDVRKRSQIVHYRHLLKQSNIDIAKHYINGELALILDCAFQWKAGAVGTIASNEVRCVYGFDFPILIFHNNSPGVRSSRYWNEQQVLIRNVQVVKHLNETVSAECVRLYVGHDPVEKFRATNIYFSPVEKSFHIFPGLPNGKFGPLIKGVKGMPFDGTDVGVVDGGPQIVESVSDNQRHRRGELRHVGKCVDDILRSNWLVSLDSGSVTIPHRGDDSLQVRNVFIGPFNFESGCDEAVHVCDSTGDALG